MAQKVFDIVNVAMNGTWVAFAWPDEANLLIPVESWQDTRPQYVQ